jgi:hypothetical protein
MYSHALRRLALVAGIVTVVMPVSVAAGSPGQTRPAPHRGLGVGQLMNAMTAAPSAAAARRIWFTAQARSTLAQFEPGAARPATGPSQDPFHLVEAPLVAAGDLTGSGRNVVLDTRIKFTRAAFVVGLTARNARTGRALWARRVGSATHIVLPLALSWLGNQTRGLLVADLSFTVTSPQSNSFSATIEAWSGKTGKTLWSSTPVTGSMVTAGGVTTFTNVPNFPGAFQALPGRPLDGLIPVESATTKASDPVLGDGPGSTTAVLVSGTNGASTSPYPTVTSATGSPLLQPVPDLDRDGLADVVAVVPGRRGAITALRGTDGAQIWSNNLTVGKFFNPMFSVGRLSGGKVPDLVLDARGLTLLRGRDGKVLWSRHFAEQVVALGPVRPGHAAALAIVGESESGSLSPTGKGRLASKVDIRAVTAANRVVWRRPVRATIHFTKSHQIGGSSGAEAAAIGDVQPDGTVDFAVRVHVTSGHKHATTTGVVSGRTGSFRPGVFGSATAGSLVRGRGTDLLHVARSATGIVLSGYDGNTLAPLMRTLIRTSGEPRRPFALGLRATGHRCGDIEAAGGVGHDRRLVALVAASGAPIWSLRFSAHRVTGGHVVRYQAPQHFCAK